MTLGNFDYDDIDLEKIMQEKDPHISLYEIALGEAERVKSQNHLSIVQYLSLLDTLHNDLIELEREKELPEDLYMTRGL